MRSPIKCASARTYRSRPRELTSTSTPWRLGTTRWFPAMAVVCLWRERTPKSITKLVAILSPKVTFSCQLFRVRSRRPRPDRKIKSYRASYMRQPKKKTTLRATSNPTTSCPISQTFEPIRLWERKGLRPSQGFKWSMVRIILQSNKTNGLYEEFTKRRVRKFQSIIFLKNSVRTQLIHQPA